MKKGLCFILGFLWAWTGYAQQYHFKNYSVGDGLAQSQVYALLKDSRAFVWMGTQGGGLSCFDGIEFTNYTVKDGLSSNYILCLKESSSREIIIGTTNGLDVFNGQSFQHFTLDSINPVQCTDIEIDSKGTTWCATSRGLYYFQKDHWLQDVTIGEFKDDYIYDLLIDSTGCKWLATDQGLVRSDSSGPVLFTQKEGLSSDLINTLEIDRENRLWIGTYGGGVSLLDLSTKEYNFDRLPGMNTRVIYDFIEDKDKMWIGTLNEGLLNYEYQTQKINRFVENSGLPNDQVRSLEIDDWGSLWIGTSGGGVSCYSGQRFQYYSRDNGLLDKQVYSILQTGNNEFYIGNGNSGVLQFFPDSIRPFRSIPQLTNGKVKALFQDSKGRIWMGTSGEGVVVIEADTTWSIKANDGLTSQWIKAFEEDSLGNIYIATSGGGINKVEWDKEDRFSYRLELINNQMGLLANRITDLVFDKYQRLWYATTSNGIGVRMKDGTVLSFGPDQGLNSLEVRSLEIDSLGWLWIGTSDEGILRMNLNAQALRFEKFDIPDGKSSKNIYFIQFDTENHLWYGTESGVNNVLLDENRNPLEWSHFGLEEGYYGIEACTNASIMDHKGNLWFGTIDGMNRTHPAQSLWNDRAPEIRLRSISLFYKPLADTHLKKYLDSWGGVKDTLVLTYTQNHLSFDFVGINLPHPEKVLYQWQMQGIEKDWSPLSKKNNISYSNMDPGNYTFMVKACNEDGVCNQEPKVVHFQILAPFWQKLKYRLAFAIILLAAIGLLFWWRIREVKRKAKAKNERLVLEKNVIELEQKALRLQMNPHFIFNSLNSIQGLIARDDPKLARLYLSRFSRLMRQTLENSREGMISIEEEIETLSNYLDLEQFTHNHCFEYEIVSHIEDDSISIPPLIIQPFVENSIIHGVLPKKEGGKISVRFIEKENQLWIEIEDNGIGRKKSAELRSSLSTAYHKSAGMDVTSERVEALGEGSKIETLDLIDHLGNVVGTKVSIRISKIE